MLGGGRALIRIISRCAASARQRFIHVTPAVGWSKGWAGLQVLPAGHTFAHTNAKQPGVCASVCLCVSKSMVDCAVHGHDEQMSEQEVSEPVDATQPEHNQQERQQRHGSHNAQRTRAHTHTQRTHTYTRREREREGDNMHTYLILYLSHKAALMAFILKL